MNPINTSRESIFSSSIRSFCNAFFCVLGILICSLVVIFVVTLGLGTASSAKTSFTIQPDAEGKRTTLTSSHPVILKISINGIIGTGQLITSAIESTLLDSREGLLKNDRVKAIFLHVDTPGGTVTDSNGIYEALIAYKNKYHVPIFAFVDGTCASGGMYITSAADRIYASSVSVIGSVGVILGPVFNFYDLMDTWGIKTKTISKGKDKTMLNPFTNWQPGEDDSLYKMTDYLYEHFVNLVTAARTNLNKDKLINEYGAQVYAAPLAEELGFIDTANANYSLALKDLTTAAGLKENEAYQVVELKLNKSFLAELIDTNSRLCSSNILEKIFKSNPLNELSDPFLYLYRPY